MNRVLSATAPVRCAWKQNLDLRQFVTDPLHANRPCRQQWNCCSMSYKFVNSN
jgi:hypothetical protein